MGNFTQDSPVHDCDGHGTHVAATAVGRNVGVAKEANVVAVRVLDCEVRSPFLQISPAFLTKFPCSTVICCQHRELGLLATSLQAWTG